MQAMQIFLLWHFVIWTDAKNLHNRTEMVNSNNCIQIKCQAPSRHPGVKRHIVLELSQYQPNASSIGLILA